MKKVLFSPVGSTDPISNCRDGGMLHICRVFLPDKVYLYISKEMCKYHKKDDRYREAIRLLEKELSWTCEVEVICDEEMEDVQIFDAFINLFEEKLELIRKTDTPEQILVNVSSGTPAMKSSLQMLSYLWNDVKAIQVATPAKSSNKLQEDKDTYDLNLQWECNEDRKKEFENRCIVSESKNLIDRMRKENMEKYILICDYEAAKMMAGTMSEPPQEKFMQCLEIAIARSKLNIMYVNQGRKRYQLQSWFPVVDARDMKEFEYLLAMQTKLERKRYVDFVRDITPIFFSLSEKALKQYGNLRFDDIGNHDVNSEAWNLDVTKMSNLNLQMEPGWGNYTNISSYVIFKILKHLPQELQQEQADDVLDLMTNIRKAERKVRTLAAHEIVGVTYDWIVNKINTTPEQIMDMLFELADKVGLAVSRQNRRAYDIMNQGLIKLLHEQDT